MEYEDNRFRFHANEPLVPRLDHLKDLGVDCVWLLRMYPSPFRDDGYDIADYCAVHPQYGTLDDFRAFLEAAHDRGLRVITEPAGARAAARRGCR